MDDKINLTEILEQHKLWLADHSTGKRACLTWVSLGFANLRGADLREADFTGADFTGADLRGADLTGADLTYAIFSDTKLSGSNLKNAILNKAEIRSTSLINAINIPDYVSGITTIATADTKTGWKKLRNGCIAQLSIPAEAKRSNGASRSCRCEFADVVGVWDREGNEIESGLSEYDSSFNYTVGKRVTCDMWNDDRWYEYTHGIHFFLTRSEAEAY